MSATTATSTFAPTANLYRLNVMLANKAVKDVSAEHLTVRPDDKMNSFAWLLGHMTRSRCFIARLCGLEAEAPYGDLFARGQGPGESAEYPPVAEILELYNAVSKRIDKRLAEITDEELAAPIDDEYPSQEKNLRGALTFMVFHESVHVGQMMSLRRYFGYSGLVG